VKKDEDIWGNVKNKPEERLRPYQKKDKDDIRSQVKTLSEDAGNLVLGKKNVSEVRGDTLWGQRMTLRDEWWKI
jgi:hypothetical protein